MRRIHLIVNPLGGRRGGNAVLKEVEPLFRAADVQLFIDETQYAGHARGIVQTLDFEGVDAICAIGGDGTMHEMVNGLLTRSDGETLPLGLIPGGTGNSFLHSFECFDPRDAVGRIVTGKTRSIDAARVTLGEQTLFAFNIVGWGMVTDILIHAEKFRWLGENRYTVASALEVLKSRRRAARLIIDGRESEEDYIFILACNTPYTGKGMYMAPRADLTDGLIDVVIVRKATRLQMLRLLPKVFDGSYIHSPLVEYVQAREYSLIPAVDEIVNVDGELLERSPIHVTMVPQAFQVYI